MVLKLRGKTYVFTLFGPFQFIGGKLSLPHRHPLYNYSVAFKKFAAPLTVQAKITNIKKLLHRYAKLEKMFYLHFPLCLLWVTWRDCVKLGLSSFFYWPFASTFGMCLSMKLRLKWAAPSCSIWSQSCDANFGPVKLQLPLLLQPPTKNGEKNRRKITEKDIMLLGSVIGKIVLTSFSVIVRRWGFGHF